MKPRVLLYEERGVGEPVVLYWWPVRVAVLIEFALAYPQRSV